MSLVASTEELPAIATVDEVDARAAEGVARTLAAAADRKVDSRQWIDSARDRAHELPIAVRRRLREFRRASGPKGALLVRGLPVDESAVGPTPTEAGSVQRDATVPASLLMMIASTLGDPFAFRPEKTGAMVQDVVPVPGKESFQGNAGSVLLAFHNENAFHRFRPDYVLLLCLRSDHEGIAGLTTSCIRDVYPMLDEQTRQTLFTEEFVTSAPPSFGDIGDETLPHAVLTGDPADPDVRVDFAATKPTTDRAAAALLELQQLFAQHAQVLRLQPGDLAIVDNRVTVHGRTAFEPRYDGKDRWLQRTFSLVDFRATRALRADDGHVM